MEKVSENNKRIAKNTLMLYFRMLFLMAISLYTSRITLNALGVVDYGIYNIVGGVVATLSFLRTTLTTSTQRFITFELGIGNQERLKSVFANSIAIHILLSIIVIVAGEGIGVWFLNSHLNIPHDRLLAANVVLQCAIGTFVFNLINVPYNGLIIAHEKMNAFAYISILEAILKVIIVFAIYISPCDKLILYAILWFIVSIIIQLVYHTYCVKHFDESKVKPRIERNLFKKLLSFSSFNLLEIFANMLANQGVNILLNLHFGPAVNAAQGIATQVNNAINGFSNNFSTAINPQITKNFASGQRRRMWNLVFSGNKLSFFLFLIISMPIYMKIEFILSIWLTQVPEYSAIFIKLMILTNLLILLTKTFYTTISATGNIKMYQITFGVFRLMVFPTTWFVLNYISKSPISVFIVAVIFEFLGISLKMYLLKRQLFDFNSSTYVKSTLFPCSLVLIIGYILANTELALFSNTFLGLIEYIILCCFSLSSITFIIGLNKKEKSIILDIVKKKFIKK